MTWTTWAFRVQAEQGPAAGTASTVLGRWGGLPTRTRTDVGGPAAPFKLAGALCGAAPLTRRAAAAAQRAVGRRQTWQQRGGACWEGVWGGLGRRVGGGFCAAVVPATGSEPRTHLLSLNTLRLIPRTAVLGCRACMEAARRSERVCGGILCCSEAHCCRAVSVGEDRMAAERCHQDVIRLAATSHLAGRGLQGAGWTTARSVSESSRA